MRQALADALRWLADAIEPEIEETEANPYDPGTVRYDLHEQIHSMYPTDTPFLRDLRPPL